MSTPKFQVVVKHQVTGKLVESRSFRTLAEAQQWARDFNRFSQDQTWNAPVAYVETNR